MKILRVGGMNIFDELFSGCQGDNMGHLDGTCGIEYKLVGPIDGLKCLVQGLN